jgi:hypothetical protein
MATAAPHVKLLRQLASAKDDYLSGAFDISWDGAKATLYLVFGRPSHAVFDTDQAQIEGEAAIDALLSELPRTFVVSDWRRAMSPQETLSITIDELAGPFVRLAGSYADDPVTDATPEWWSADDSSPDLAFGLADFPLLPGGRPLWEETSPEDVNLGERLAGLPPSVLVLTGAKLRAAAVVSGGDLIDAVWIDADDQARGEAAGMAILGATKGSLAGYALDDPRVAEALTMLWRLPLAVSGIELAWLDPASMLAAFHADGRDRVLVIDAPVRGIALFSRGGLVAVYSETQRSAVASPERLRSLLSQARGRLTVMERKPRPLAADATDTQPSATEFFSAAGVGSHPDGEIGAEAPAVASEAGAVDRGVAEQGPVAQDAAAESGAVAADLAIDPAAPAAVVAGAEPDATGAASAPLPPALTPDTEIAATGDIPLPQAHEIANDAEPAPKRPWWAFGRSRRNRAAASRPQDGEPVAAESDAASSSGWSVRQPEAGPKPDWYRTGAGSGRSDDMESSADAPSIATDASSDDAGTSAPATASPVEEPGASVIPDPEATAADTDGDADAAAPPEPRTAAVDDEPIAGFETADEPPPTDAPESLVADDFWAEFATRDPDSETDHAAVGPLAESQAPAETEPNHVEAPTLAETEPDHAELQTVAEAQPVAETDPDHPEPAVAETPPFSEDRRDPNRQPFAPEGIEPFRRRSSERTVAPWSWPLAEAESPAAPVSTAAPSTSMLPPSDDPVTGAVPPEPTTHEPEAGFDEGFFQRDEPVGSQFVDFDEVRKELVRIGVVWLGESNAEPVTALLSKTRSTIDDFVATIDTIRGLQVEGQDPASIQAMAREMHQQAAERLCGA